MYGVYVEPAMKGYFITLRMIKRILITTISLSMAFILGTAAAGSYHILAASGPGSDLIVQDITLSPENPAIGDSVTFTFTIKNQGTESAGASYVAYYIDDTYIKSKYIESLNAGAAITTTYTWEAQVGSHTIKAVADAQEQVNESDETNNTKTFTLSPLAPDLIVPSVSWLPENPSRGESITFTVAIKNQGTRKSGFCRVNFYIDGISRGYQDVYAVDVGATVTKTYTWVATVGQHDIKAIIDEDNYVAESDEANNALTVTFSTLPPDLVIESITWSPENPSKSDNITFIVAVKNQGSGRADSCPIAYYINDSLFATDTVASIEAGVSTNMTFNRFALEESSDVRVVVDLYNHITESNETNNERTVIFSTLLPDLVIQDITWSPTDAAVGDNVTFTVTIRNQGAGRAEESRLTLYIDGHYTGYVILQELDAGAEATQTFDWPAVSGSHDVKVVADSDSLLVESIDTNNENTKTISIIPADLIVQDIIWSPTDAVVGDTVTFTVVIKNQGSGQAEYFRVAYYIDDDLYSSGYVNRVESGASANMTFSWKIQNGKHAVMAIVDSSEQILESDEENNANTIIVAPIMPDLLIDTITWSPADFSPGDEVNFSVAIKNQGSQRANSFRMTYYVDGSIAGYRDMDGLDIGATLTEEFPWMATAGIHGIKIAVDANNQVTEGEENNNVKTLNLPPPDLIIHDITWSPTEAGVGDTVTFNVIAQNQGIGKTTSSHVACYVNGSPLGNDEVPVLAAGDTVTSTFTWVAEVGDNVINIAVDPENLVTEIDETNNERTIDFSTLTPDLVIQDISWSMEDSLLSYDIDFVITIENQGSGKADISELALYVDDSSESCYDVPQIDAGATTAVTFDSIIGDGEHTIIAVADSSNQVVELDEANNEETLDFSTLVPDLVVRGITVSPTVAAVGDTVTFTVSIKNQGRVKSTNSRVALYINDSLIGSCALEEINTGAVITKTFDWITEASSFEVSAVVDLDDMVSESNEINNTELRTLSLSAAGGTIDNTGELIDINLRSGGFFEDSWWLLILAVLIFGGIAFIAAFRSSRNR